MEKAHFFNCLVKATKAERYLEVGVDDPDKHFNKIECTQKWGVDPYQPDGGSHNWDEGLEEEMIARIDPDAHFHRTTSKEFFSTLPPRRKFDIIFLDGLHTAEQIASDFWSASRRIRANGIILIDDIFPNTVQEAMPRPVHNKAPWRGDVWKFWLSLRAVPQEFKMFAVDLAAPGVGGHNYIGVVDFSVKENGTPRYYVEGVDVEKMTLQEFWAHKEGLLLPASPDTALEYLKTFEGCTYR